MNMDASESAVAAASNMLISSLEKSAACQGKFLNFSLPMERLCKFILKLLRFFINKRNTNISQFSTR